MSIFQSLVTYSKGLIIPSLSKIVIWPSYVVGVVAVVVAMVVVVGLVMVMVLMLLCISDTFSMSLALDCGDYTSSNICSGLVILSVKIIDLTIICDGDTRGCLLGPLWHWARTRYCS